MKTSLKQSEGSATSSRLDIFSAARFKLTGMYLALLFLIIASFSVFLYLSIQSDIKDTTDGNFTDEQSQTEFTDHTLSFIKNDIIALDSVIFIVSGFLSYILAGYTLKPIRKVLDDQKSFAENASHELRTPLAVMRSDAEILLRRPVTDKESVRRTLESNIEEIDRLSDLAGSLLAVARSGAIEKETKAKIDAAAIVRKAGEKMKGLAESRDINFGLEIKAGDFPAPILCREAEIERVIFNLIQNSLDHTAAGGMITLKAEKDGRAVKISIADTGSGIAEKDLPYVFDRFYKSAGSRGAGLGLSIVRQIAVEHGGTASVNSEPGAGTTVAIKIPLSSN
ncbi:HAMP domain-containing histidine kinase [Patescibacteria group bacterium]|nr:HAMP domain-containing histidine kinase [Patescibacteria group bacterium]MDE1946705.1 HAMP domain-containing histidine kinase [Patescibacteria group bacterium]MDE2010992.1 HAMP domain-containing histidine kinase [Patescibacteria group bacterium]MDE2232834.1 HAMP domain-containing histidine kinase [Patescibacteria group bacterium]